MHYRFYSFVERVRSLMTFFGDEKCAFRYGFYSLIIYHSANRKRHGFPCISRRRKTLRNTSLERQIADDMFIPFFLKNFLRIDRVKPLGSSVVLTTLHYSMIPSDLFVRTANPYTYTLQFCREVKLFWGFVFS